MRFIYPLKGNIGIQSLETAALVSWTENKQIKDFVLQVQTVHL